MWYESDLSQLVCVGGGGVGMLQWSGMRNSVRACLESCTSTCGTNVLHCGTCLASHFQPRCLHMSLSRVTLLVVLVHIGSGCYGLHTWTNPYLYSWPQGFICLLNLELPGTHTSVVVLNPNSRATIIWWMWVALESKLMASHLQDWYLLLMSHP